MLGKRGVTTYQCLKSVKGQLVADFIVDHSMVEESLNFVDVQPWSGNLNYFT